MRFSSIVWLLGVLMLCLLFAGFAIGVFLWFVLILAAISIFDFCHGSWVLLIDIFRLPK